MTAFGPVFWPVEKLIPDAQNAHTHSDEQVARLATSIFEDGWTDPILADTDGTIIDGHARLLAARILDLTEVPVMVFDHLTEAKRRALAELGGPRPARPTEERTEAPKT